MATLPAPSELSEITLCELDASETTVSELQWSRRYSRDPAATSEAAESSQPKRSRRAHGRTRQSSPDGSGPAFGSPPQRKTSTEMSSDTEETYQSKRRRRASERKKRAKVVEEILTVIQPTDSNSHLEIQPQALAGVGDSPAEIPSVGSTQDVHSELRGMELRAKRNVPPQFKPKTHSVKLQEERPSRVRKRHKRVQCNMKSCPRRSAGTQCTLLDPTAPKVRHIRVQCNLRNFNTRDASTQCTLLAPINDVKLET